MRKLTARLDRYNYRLDLESGVLILKIHGNREAKLKLLVSSKSVEKFIG
ncbi:MAG: hypothetical protein QW456_11295 [Ignisphaera sp.]